MRTSKGGWVVVLNDGETFTSLRGCSLVYLPDEAFECDLGEADQFEDIVEEELGEAVSRRIVRLDLEAVLRHGYKLSQYEEVHERTGDG